MKLICLDQMNALDLDKKLEFFQTNTYSEDNFHYAVTSKLLLYAHHYQTNKLHVCQLLSKTIMEFG